MTAIEQHRLGKALWAIADKLRGSMMADDFRDYMLSFIFLRYLSEQYEEAVKKELGSDYPAPPKDVMTKLKANTPLQIWYEKNPDDIVDFEQQMRRKAHYVILPKYLWGNIVELARTQDKELLDTYNRSTVLSVDCSRKSTCTPTNWARHTKKETPCSVRLLQK